MQHETIHSLFEDARKQNPVFRSTTVEVFRLPAPLDRYVVKFDPQRIKQSLLMGTILRPHAHGLSRNMGQTILTSNNGVEIKLFVEGKSLQDILNEKQNEIISPTSPEQNVAAFNHAKIQASRHVAKLLAELPVEQFLPMMEDVKELTAKEYKVDPFIGNIMLTPTGLRLIDYKEGDGSRYSFTSDVKDDLEHLFLEGCNEGPLDAEVTGWREAIFSKLDKAAAMSGVGTIQSRKPAAGARVAFAGGSSSEVGNEIPMVLSPAVLRKTLIRLEHESGIGLS